MRYAAWISLTCVLACHAASQPEHTQESQSPAIPTPFTADEVRRILALSPLGDPPPDPTNSVYESEAAAHLGRALFFDPRLSKNGDTSCASCHDPDKGWGDGLPLAKGVTQLERQSMTLWNVAYNRWFFWDGRADTLWSQALIPLENPFEHASSRLQVAHVIHGDPEMRSEYEALFGRLPELDQAHRFPPEGRPVPEADDLHLMLHKVSRTPDASARAADDGHIEAPFIHPHQRAWDSMNSEDQEAVTQVFANAGKSIAAFERRIVFWRAPFDIFVEGLRENDERKLAALGPAERRGLSVFLTRAHCHVCHTGPTFTDREFHDVRIPLRAEAPADPGREQGLEIVRRSPFNGVGSHSDAPTSEVGRKVDYLPWHVHEQAEFKTPTLRNVAVTAPYMHQGQFATLEEVVRFYSTLDGAAESSTTETILLPLELDDGEIADLVAFLVSLTDEPLDPSLMQPSESQLPE